jgi:mRNA interferase MazF
VNIVSVDILNTGAGGLVVVVPVTSAAYGLRSHVELDAGTTGLTHTSYARCDQLRTISTHRLSLRRGTASPPELRAVEQALRFVLNL